tara:strand:- start:1911 stop:3143 length:1233 start_codon:yes stop_codon:yes gene_type:complete
MAVRPIDLAFMNDINKTRSGMSFSPRATYGSTAPIVNNQIANDPVRITVNPSGVLPKPQLIQPNVVPQSTNAFSGLLGNNFADPKTMGLLGASAELLKAGGYSVGKPAPTMGEALGNAMTTGMANYLAVQQAQNKLNAPISVAKGGKVYSRDGKLLIDNSEGFGFSGTGMTNQASNTLLKFSEGAKNGTLTPAEMAKYKLAYGYLNKEKNIPIPNDKGGVDYIKEAPQNLDGFFNPFPENRETSKVGEKPSAQKLKILENKPKLDMMLGNLNRYRAKLSDLETLTQARGAFGIPTAEASKVSAMAEKLRLDIKNLYELGALVGGDFQILDNLLTSPTSSQGVMMGSSGLIAQLSELEETLVSKLNSYGVSGNIGSFSSPIVINSEDAWKKATPNLYYKLPDGKTVLKGRN